MKKQKIQHGEKFKELEDVLWPEPTGEEIEAIIENVQKEDGLSEEVARELVEGRAGRIHDVRKLLFAELQAELKGEEAVTDALTGLTNRGGFNVRMEAAVATAKRYEEPFCLIMIDIDHFKQFNDKYGHSLGDIVLKEVARILKETARQTDMVARYGGEEFVVVLEKTNIKNAKVAAEKLRKAIEEQTKNQDYPPVTISAGFAEFNQRDETLNTDEAIKESADKALYHAKVEGRNQVVAYEKDMTMPEDIKLLKEMEELMMQFEILTRQLRYQKEILELVEKHKPHLINETRKELTRIKNELTDIRKQVEEKRSRYKKPRMAIA